MSFDLINEWCPAAHTDILECACKMMYKMEQERSWMLLDEYWHIFAEEVKDELSRQARVTYRLVKAGPLKVYTREGPVIKERLRTIPAPAPVNCYKGTELMRPYLEEENLPVSHTERRAVPHSRQVPPRQEDQELALHPNQHSTHLPPQGLDHLSPVTRKRSARYWDEESGPQNKRHRSRYEEPRGPPPQSMHPPRDPRSPQMGRQDPKWKAEQEDLSDRIFHPREKKPLRYNNQRRNYKPYPNHRARSISRSDAFSGSTGRYKDQYGWDGRGSGGWEDRDREYHRERSPYRGARYQSHSDQQHPSNYYHQERRKGLLGGESGERSGWESHSGRDRYDWYPSDDEHRYWDDEW